ncbi:MAG TPA: LPS assembly lipoprotein LptE [Planctomycetota bacterium]|nr:LPS assembly lipoprotein LptE [Planctomycetota bacterium]
MITLRMGLALALALAAGCGYSTGVRLPEQVQTVGVEIFGNDSKQRDIEVELQRLVADAVARLVHARLVPPDQADLVVRGRIVEYVRRNGIRSPQNELLETGVRITLEVQLVQRFEQSLVVEGDEPERTDLPPMRSDDRNSMPRTAQNERVVRPLRASQEFGYLTNENFAEPVARERTLRNLAERVVLDLFTALPPLGQP